jgi:predicted nucleic acid-binding protein
LWEGLAALIAAGCGSQKTGFPDENQLPNREKMGKVEYPADKSGTTVVLTDANVLINLIHIGQLRLFRQLQGFRFVVPDHVVAEINQRNQEDALCQAINEGMLEQTSITDLDEMSAYAELHRTLGQGEAACLAIAVHRGYAIASDEKRAFRRTAIKRIGKERLFDTVDLLVLLIRAGLVSVAQADQWKTELEKLRFKMKFESFKDLL